MARTTTTSLSTPHSLRDLRQIEVSTVDTGNERAPGDGAESQRGAGQILGIADLHRCVNAPYLDTGSIRAAVRTLPPGPVQRRHARLSSLMTASRRFVVGSPPRIAPR